MTCLCCTFGITDDVAHARASARTVGFDVRTVRLDETVAREAAAEIVDDVVAIETGESEALPSGDYETELRALIAAEYGRGTVERCFPTHVQSRVTGRLDAPKS